MLYFYKENMTGHLLVISGKGAEQCSGDPMFLQVGMLSQRRGDLSKIDYFSQFWKSQVRVLTQLDSGESFWVVDCHLLFYPCMVERQ
jgi:hypothetical protein